MILSQKRYAHNLLKTEMDKCKPMPSPMESSQRLTRGKGLLLTCQTQVQYRSIVGGLQYLTITRPDISFIVSKVCLYIETPTRDHWSAVKRILRYIQGTLDSGLKIQISSSTKRNIFFDAGWAGCLDDRRSTNNFVVYLGPNLVSWYS